jgi:hypothetical protein
MPSLISATERANLTGIFNDIFDTFKRTIVVYREPIKTQITNTDPNNFVFGFGESQGEEGYTYTQVSGVFDATIRYQPQSIQINPDANIVISDGDLSIKVKKDCRDFINAGKVEKILVDERTFILNSEEEMRSFLDSQFWVFRLKAIK